MVMIMVIITITGVTMATTVTNMTVVWKNCFDFLFASWQLQPENSEPRLP